MLISPDEYVGMKYLGKAPLNARFVRELQHGQLQRVRRLCR